MPKLVVVYGGSGFVGRYVARRMARAGWRVRVAVRRPNEALFVRPYGTPGQVEPVFCNIRDDASVADAMQGADAVVNCVGVLAETGANSFDAVHSAGAGRIARLAAQAGIAQLVHLSAIGAAADGPSDYARSKAAGEAAVRDAMPGAVILRPSIIFGTEDQFFNRFAQLARFSPFLPLIGGATRFQPVYVDDVAAAVEAALRDPDLSGVFELGGPEVHDFRNLMAQMLAEIRRNRVIVNLPFGLARVLAFCFDLLQTITLGLVPNLMATADQVRSLTVDNVVAEGARGLGDLGIAATSLSAVLPDYLWPFRPSGQYAQIKESARNLRS